MAHNVLVTAPTGYLGGDLLAGLVEASLPQYGKLFGLATTPEERKAVRQFGAEPLDIDIFSPANVNRMFTENNITVVFYLINAASFNYQPHMINALAEVKHRTGMDVHFIHVRL
jgi:hypothetical protein